MRFRKLISAMIASIMLIASLSLPASAALNENISGANSGSGYSGNLRMDTSWSPGMVDNRSGYRISIYYAPQEQNESGEWVYNENGEPVYDWSQVQQVGNIIDIRRDAMCETNNKDKIILPNRWGIWSVWDYLKWYGGAYKGNFKSQKQGNKDYYYYQFTNEDRYVRNTNSDVYMCALFNPISLTNTDDYGAGIEDSSFVGENSSYKKIYNQLKKIESSTSDDKTKQLIAETIGKLEESNNYVMGEYNLPLVDNSSERKSGKADNSTDDLKQYLINPVILNLIAEASNGKFTAEDFYFGTWDGNDSVEWETIPSDKKKYPRGTYKMIIENMTATGNGDGANLLCCYTLADSIAMINDKGTSVFVQLGVNSYLDDMANSLTLRKTDSVLRFGNTNKFMGDLIDYPNQPVKIDVSRELHDDNFWKECSEDGILGNYSGLAVIDSDSIYSRADVSKSQIVNEVMVSRVGKPDLGVTGLQINTDAAELSQFVSSDAINALCAAFDNEDVNLIAERAGLEDDGFKLQLTALCDAIRRGRAYGLDSSEIKVAIRDAYNWDGYDTAQLYDFQPILF